MTLSVDNKARIVGLATRSIEPVTGMEKHFQKVISGQASPLTEEERDWLQYWDSCADAHSTTSLSLSVPSVSGSTFTKTIVCLANSRKTSGRCVAGKEWCSGSGLDWIRPVTSRPAHELSPSDCCYANGREADIFDIIEVSFARRLPAPYQRENCLVAPQLPWTCRGRISWSDAKTLLDAPPALWSNSSRSMAGLNNRVLVSEAFGDSLFLIPVDTLTLIVGKKSPQYSDSKRSVLGEFRYRNVLYRMDVTDPFIEHRYLNEPDGRRVLATPIICVSLGEPFTDGYCYKLIATVLFKERFRE